MYRSYLISPASDTHKMEKALGSGADAVIFDLEDGVAPAQKDAARANLVRFLEQMDWVAPSPAVFVRVNGAMTPWFHRDLEAVYHPQVSGYMVPKVESRETLATAEAVLLRAAGREDAPFSLIPFIESAHALWHLPAIVHGQRRVPRVVFGGEDFATELGIRARPGGWSYVVPRGLLVLLSRVAGLEPPVDTVYAAFRDEAGLRAELAQAKELGCFGKLAIHPAQIPPINEAFTPSEDEVAWARQVLDAFAASLAAGRGVGRADDAMVEQPIAERARRLLALAEAIGVGPGAGPPHPPDAARLSGAGGRASAAAGAGQQGGEPLVRAKVPDDSAGRDKGPAPAGHSLVPPEAWALVGRQIGPGAPITIHAHDVERFCRVIGEENPVFFDEEAARRSGHRGRPMPLPFPLTRFPSGDERSFAVPLHAPRRVRGEDELIVLRPIVVGDRIRARTRLLDIEEKPGRSGPMVFVRFETEYLLDDGEVAMIVRTTIVRR